MDYATAAPNKATELLASVKLGEFRLCVTTAIRTTIIDAKTIARFEKANAWLLKNDGNGYRLRSGKNSVYLLPGQLKIIA